MCKNINHGGQRCASDTRKGIDAAAKAHKEASEAFFKAVDGHVSPSELEEARKRRTDATDALRQAHIEHASTPTGLREAKARLAKAEAAGDTFQAASERHLIEQGNALREKNKAVGDAIKAATTKKAAKRAAKAAPVAPAAPAAPAAPTPTRPDGKMVDASVLIANNGGCFVDPGSGDVVEIHRAYPWGDGGWQFDTTDGWSVCVEKGQLIEMVPDTTATTGETFTEYAADYAARYHPNAITEDEFEKKYQPVWNDDEAMTDDPPAGVDTKNVWTIVEGEHDYQYAVPGIHVVNRVGYIQTEKPWETGQEEAIWVDGSEYHD